MINVSSEFKETIRERTDFRCGALITLADETEIELGAGDFSLVGSSITDGAGASALPFGEAVCRSLQIEFRNDAEQYSDVDFVGATIQFWISLPLTATTETVQEGAFTVHEPASCGETVVITALDDMWRTEKPWTTELDFPCTLAALFREACTSCGIPWQSDDFTNADFVVEAAPTDECSFREILGWIAQIAGGNARISCSGYMEILSYDFDRSSADHALYDWVTPPETDTDDVVITGVRTRPDDGEEILVGTDGYVLSVENPLIAGKEQVALTRIAAVMVGARLRKFEGDHVGYPLAEFMDTALVYDRQNRSVWTVLTDIHFAIGGLTTLSNSAESALRNGMNYGNQSAATIQSVRRLIANERNERQTQAAQLQELIAAASGMYTTEEIQPDGSTIRYLHDKPTLAASASVMKLTADAIGFSTDGGESYPFGLAVNGDVVSNLLAAVGVSAEWIRIGTMSPERIEGLESMFTVSEERILAEVSRSYATEENVSSRVTQTAEALTVQLRGELSVLLRLTAEGIELGQEGSDVSLLIKPDRVAFLDKGQQVAYISDRKLYITEAEILTQLVLGRFAFVPRENGNLSFLKVV